MNSLETILSRSEHLKSDIISYIGDKPIVIVGSSKDISHLKINYPIVVRLNSSRRWGDCDIWFNNYCNGLDEHYKSSGSNNEKFIIRGNGDRDGSNMIRNYPEEWYNKTYFWDPKYWKEMTEEINIDRPLTGTIAAYWFLRYTTSKITLLNFDFYKTVKIHTVRKIVQPAPVHKPELDEAYLKNNNRIEWAFV
jgi:hypothetical protein